MFRPMRCLRTCFARIMTLVRRRSNANEGGAKKLERKGRYTPETCAKVVEERALRSSMKIQ